MRHKVGFEDFSVMQVQHHGRNVKSPLWSMDDAKVRQVLVTRICRTAREPNLPQDLASLRQIESRYVDVLLRQGSRAAISHIDTLKRFGGPAAFFAALCYRRFRLGQDSIELAEQFGMKHEAVRMNVHRFCLIARSLFPDPALHLPWSPLAKRAKALRP